MLKFFTTPSGVLFVMMNGIKMKVRISTKVKGYKYVMGKTILATVVCTQLGFSGGKVTHNSMFGKTKRKFWMDSLFCTGNEKSLPKCQFGGFGKADCKNSESAGVICKPKLQKLSEKWLADNKVQKFSIHSNDEMEIRLAGGRSMMEGRLEVFFFHIDKDL